MISYERLDRELQAFVTNSGIPPADVMATMTLDAAKHTIPRMLDLALTMFPERRPCVVDVTTFDHPSREELGGLLQRAGSDKSTGHNYHHLYAHILGPRRDEQLQLFEVGLGTNHPEVPSSMGAHGTPGASLRAFRDFLPNPNARVFGADVDKRILFQEERIWTYFVDQTEPATFDALWRDLPGLDLIIDDGLHSTHANLAFLNFAVKPLNPGGWIVIEDIRDSSLPLWHLVSIFMPPERYSTWIVRGHWGWLFVVQRRA